MEIISLPMINKGKVRDIYEIKCFNLLLIVTSDRISAFDKILESKIPNKGKILNKISEFWFNFFEYLIPNHMTGISAEKVIHDKAECEYINDRYMVVKKLTPLPIEAIVRGYVVGSGWKDYQKTGSICGIELPKGLKLAEQLDEPIFTPSSKADIGLHDENISINEMEKLIGKELTEQVKNISIEIYKTAYDHLLPLGIILADTKIEYGLDENNCLIVADELITPDSSRFWILDEYKIGSNPKSYDKQYIRDYLTSLDKPSLKLPQHVIDYASKKYNDIADIIIN